MATTFAPNVSLLVNNTAGAVQQLPDERVGGKTRNWVERITLAGAAIGDFIVVARIPYGSVPLDILVATDTSLGSSTVAIGDKINVSRFATAGTLTGTTALASKILPTAVGVALTTAYDYLGVASTQYEDVLLCVGVSSLPSSGTLTVITKYLDYGS